MVSKWLACLGIVTLGVALSVPGHAATPRVAPHHQLTATDWPTYHKDNSRHGEATDLAPVSTLTLDWQADLDGAVYGQPLVIGGQVIAATENNTVYSLDATTGAVTWSAHLADPASGSELPCGNIAPLGITSTPVYDPTTGRVFVLAELAGGGHDLFGVNLATGAQEVRLNAEPPQGSPVAHQQRGALTLFNDRVYIPYGGLYGDCSQYIGSVVAVPTDGSAVVASYAIPTSREAGIWAPGGGAVDGNTLVYSVGNGASTSTYDGSDSVIALSPDLQRTDFFAPTTWAEDNARDLDLGSLSPALVGDFVFIAGKRGIGYVLRHDSYGGIGGEVSQADVCRAFGATAVDSAGTVYVPCTDGLHAVAIDAAGGISQLWQASAGRGSPVVGGGAVWVVDYSGGVLSALDPATGSALGQINIGTAPHFASPTLSGSHAYVGTLGGVVAVGGA